MADILNFNFNIPKIRRKDTKDNLRSVSVKGRDAQDVLDIAQRSYLDRNYKPGWDIESVQLVENKILEESYRTKKAEMKEDGRHSRELVEQYVYIMYKDSRIVQKIAQDGLKTRELSFNSLGNSNLGVYLCKHADVQLRMYDSWLLQDTGQLMVFKVTLGRSKVMNLQPAMIVDPTPNYDCHINQLKPSPTDALNIQNNRSQIYLYEYDDDCEPVQRPRHCLPYAVITYKKNRDASLNLLSGSIVNSYNRPIKMSEVKIPETITNASETGVPVLSNRSKSDVSQKFLSSAPSLNDPRRQLSKQERRELFERQHAELLRQQNMQDRRSSTDLNESTIYHSSTSTAFSKVQTRQDPRVKNSGTSLGPPQTTNVVKPKSPTRGIDYRRSSHENQHPGIGYQKQLSVNIPRQRYLSGGSPSPDGDNSISDALTDLIVKNQVKMDVYGRPILTCPSPNKIEEERQQSINQRFADEIQKHLQMTGTVEIPQSMSQENYTPKSTEIEVNKQSSNTIELPQYGLQEDYTPQPMEIENSETNDSILEKSDEMEFDSKISELLNEASLIKPIDITKTIDNQDSQITKDIGNIENKLNFGKMKSADVQKDEEEDDDDDDDDDDDEKLVIAEMDVETKKLEVIARRKSNTEDSLETDLLTFVSREDIKKKDPDKVVEKKEQIDSESEFENIQSKKADIVVVKEETMNKTEQLKMLREKVLKEVQSMLEKSKEKSIDKIDEAIDPVKAETVSYTTTGQENSNKMSENPHVSNKFMEKNKEICRQNVQQNTPGDFIDCELSTFSSDSDMESVRSYDENERSDHSRSSPVYYDDSPMKVDPRGPYDVQTSPQKMESKSDTWASQSRNLYDAYSDRNEQHNFEPRNQSVHQSWHPPPEQNFYMNSVNHPHMGRSPVNPQHYEQTPYPPKRNEEVQNYPPQYAVKSRSDSDMIYHHHQHPPNHPPNHPQGPFIQDTDYRTKPKDRYNMDFLSGQDMDYRQKSLIDVNPETGDVDYRRLNPVKPIQNPPQKNPDVTRNVFQSYHHNPNMQFNPPPHNINLQELNQHDSPVRSNPLLSNRNNMLSPTNPPSWGKAETIGLTSPSKDKKITFKDYKARRKNSPIRNESQKSDAGFENILQTADLDLKNLKNILETVNVVSALKKDFPDSENSRCADEKLQTHKYIDDVTKISSEPEIKHSVKMSFLNEIKDDDALFNCYGKETIPGLDVMTGQDISPRNISISSILGTNIDMTKFENKDIDMRRDKPKMNIADDKGKNYVRPYPWEHLHMNTEATEANHEHLSIDFTSGKMTPPSSCSSSRGRARKTKPKKDMMGYVKRRRRKRGKKNSNDNVSDITGETGSVASSDWKSSVEDLIRNRVMSLEEVGLNHWTDAINHPIFQPRVVLERQKEAEIGAAEIAERNELKSEKEALDSQPAERHFMVRQWVETSHKKIKLITLKRTKDEDTESVKSGKSGSGVMDDVIDIDLVEKQIAQDMAKTDDVLSISSSSDIVYQKPGPKCSKKPKLSDGNKSIPGNQSIPVLNKRKIPSSTNAQQTTSQLPTPSVSQQNYPVVQPSQGQIHGVVPPYQVSANYSVPPPSVHMSTSYQTQTPQYPVESQHHPQQYPHQVPRPTLMQTQIPHCQGQASHGQGQMNPPRHSLQLQMPPQGHQTFYPNSSFSNQCTPRFPNTQIPPYPVPDNRQQYHVQSPIFSNPPPNSFTQPIQNIQPSQQQQQQLNYNHQRPPDISHPSPDLKHPSPQISGIMQAPPSISHASQSTTYMSSSTHHQPHSHPMHPSTTTSQHQASATLDSTSQLSQNSVRPSSEIRNQTQSANNLQTSPHRLHSPQIRPIVAQASFLNRPRALYPPESIPVSAQGQLPLDQSKTTSVTTVSTSLGQPSTPTSAKRPSDVADWFADKLNPKSAQESQNEQSEKILEGITVKPKEGSLREELEKIKKNKMEEKEKPEKRKSRSRERSPISKRKKKRNDSSEYNSDIFEDSENESKRVRSSYSPSKKWSPDSRWRYNSPERRRRYSFSPRRRRSRDRSRTPSDSSIKKPDPNHKTPESRYRKSDTAVDSKSWSSGYIRRRESNSPENTRNRGSPDSDKWKRRSSNSPDYSRRRRSPDIRRPSNNFPDNTRNRGSPDSDKWKRRSSNSPDYSRRRRSPDIRRPSNNSPDNTRNKGSPDSDKWKRRSSNSPDYSRRRRSPDIRRPSNNSPDFTRNRGSPDFDKWKRRSSNSPDYARRRRSPDIRRPSNNSPDFTRNRGSPDSDKWKRRSSNSPDSARRRRSPDIRRPSNNFPDNTRNRGSPDSDKWTRRSSNSPDSARRRRSPDIRRPSNNFPDNTRNRGSPESDKWKRRSSNSPDYSRRRRSPDIRRLYSNSPDRSRTRISPQRRHSKSPEYRRGRQAPESYGSAKDRSLGYDFPLVRKRRSISPHRKSKSPKPQVSIPPKNSNDQSKTGANSKLSNNGKLNNTGQSLFDKEKKSEGNQNTNLLVKEVPNNSKSVMNNKPTKSQTDNNKWTKSNFTEYTVDQIHEEDKKIQEELIKLEEQKKILVAEDKKMKEEQRKQEDERIRNELKELEKQKKIAEDLIKFQKQKQFEEEIERQKKLAEELIELEEQRKIAEELVELEKKKKTVKEVEELNKRKRELEKVVDKPITGIDNVEKNFFEEEIVVIEEDEINELDDLAQQKEELQKALAALENVDKESDLEDGEIEDDSEEEEEKEVKKEKTTVGAEKNPIVIHSIIDLTGNASRDRGSVSKDRRSVSKDRRSSSKDRRSTYSDDRQRKNSGGSDYYEDEYTHHRSSSGQSDIKRQHAKEIGNAWGAMISHSDMRVERIKGDPYFQKKKEGNEMETGKFDDTSKQKSLTAKLRSSELITAYDLDEEQQRSKNRQELVTFADWLQMEYKISDLDIYKYQKYISCVDIHSRIDENSKNKRKTLKKRLRAEMQVAQERMKLEEIEKQNAKTTPHKPTRSVVISGIKERLENEKDGGDKRIVCDSGVQLLSEIEQLQEPFSISRQQLVSELEMVRSALKMSWKTPKNKSVDTTRNEYLGFGEGDYDNEFLMRHDLQQLEAEILMRINHFEFHGVPNRRVPDILLTQKEKKLHFSQEGLFLVLTASISHKAYQNLLSLKRKLESTESLVSTLNQATHSQQIVKHLQDIEVLHQSRKAIMLTIAGFLTKKRFSKLSTRLKYYKRCMQYIQDLWKTQLVYLSTIVADVEVHLKLGERLLQEQESGLHRSSCTNSHLHDSRVPVIPTHESKWKSIATSLPTRTNTARPEVSSASTARPEVSSTSTARPEVSSTSTARPEVSSTCYSKPSDTNQTNTSCSNLRNVEMKDDEYKPLSRNTNNTNSTTSRNVISSHTTPSTTRNTVTNTSSIVNSENLRQVPIMSTQNQSNQESKWLTSKLQRQNSNEDKEDTRQLSRGQNLNSQENSNHQNLRSTTPIDDRKVQHDPRYGMTDNENKQVPVVRGASEVLSSPYTLPSTRYLTPQERQQPLHWGSRGQPQNTPARSQFDLNLELDLMSVRNKLLTLSRQQRYDDSVRMSVQSVLLSVKEALDLLREESSNLPKVKQIILECLSRYNAVKELMEG